MYRRGLPVFLALLFKHFPASAKFGWEVFKLWQSVLHSQYGVFIINVSCRIEVKILNQRSVYIDKAVPNSVIIHYMTTTFRAPTGAVRRMRTRIRLQAQPESMRSIVGATQ